MKEYFYCCDIYGMNISKYVYGVLEIPEDMTNSDALDQIIESVRSEYMKILDMDVTIKILSFNRL